MSNLVQDDLYAAVIAALIQPVLGSSFQVVRTNDNAPKPADSYVALNLGPFAQVGWDEQGEPDPTSGDVLVYGVRETMLTVEVYGTGALQLTANLRDALNTVAVQAALRSRGFAIGTRTPVLNLTKLYETQWKERGHFEVRVRFRSETVDKAVGSIVDVKLVETIQSTGSADVTRSVEVNGA